MEIPSPFDPTKVLLCCEGHAPTIKSAMEDLAGLFAYSSEEVPARKPAVKQRKKADPAVREAGEYRCMVRGCGHNSVSQGALVQHGRTKHGMGVAEMRAAKFNI